jgi:predicted permease
VTPPGPPRLVARLLAACLPGGEVGECVAGDLREEHAALLDVWGRRIADRWYRRAALSAGLWGIGSRLRAASRAARWPGGTGMGSIGQDVHLALRSLRKQPGFATIVVLTLAVAIGVNTVIFTFVNLFVLRPLPFERIDTLVYLFSSHPERANERVHVSYADYLEWKRDSRTLSEISAFSRRTANLTGLGEPIRVQGAPASASFFRVSGLEAVEGRLFRDDEDRPGGEPVAVLAHGFWERQLGGSAEVAGREIVLDGVVHTVVGVLTPEIELGNLSEIDVWLPLAQLGDSEDRALRNLRVIARLAPGQGLEQASAEMATIAERQERDHPDASAGWGIQVLPLRTALIGRGAYLMLAMLGIAVGFVVAIACANVANLMLARATVRERETALRVALGAGRIRIVRQLLTEGALLSLVGGGLGLLLAEAGLRVIAATTFEPFYDDLRIDHRVLAFSAGLSLLAPVIFDLAPALQATRRDLATALKEGGGRSAVGARGGRGRRGLVVMQLALALTLLIVAGLSARTAIYIQNLDPGFDSRDVVTLRIDLPETRYPTPERVRRFYEGLIEELTRSPQVRGAALATRLPSLESPETRSLAVEGIVPDERVQPWAGENRVGPAFFDTLRLPIVQGRSLRETDTAAAEPVVVVSEGLADRYLAGRDPLGARIKLGGASSDDPWRTIVGVAADTVNSNLADPPVPTAYVPFDQSPARAVVVLAKSGDASAVARIARARVAVLDPSQPIYDVSTIEQIVYRDTDGTRVITSLFGLFAVVAVSLAAIGLYGVISYAVSRRTQEIGVRIALGARSSEVLSMVVAQGAKLIGLGLALGLLGGYTLARIMSSQLFGVSPNDPLTYACVTISLLVAALAATVLPARRASRVDPIEALRVE